MRTFIQIDTETLGNKPAKMPIVAVGAVAYDYEHGIFSRFYETLSFDEQMEKGRVPNVETLIFWLEQPAESRAALAQALKHGLGLMEFEDALWTWYEDVQRIKGDPYVMGKGSVFDISGLDSLLPQTPWDYRKVMCFRTICTLYQDQVKALGWSGEPAHHALKDAEAQASIHLKLMEEFECLR